jgi:hypothetical protein
MNVVLMESDTGRIGLRLTCGGQSVTLHSAAYGRGGGESTQ